MSPGGQRVDMVLEFVISGAVGGGLTIAATWGEYRRRQADRRERTRAALLTELRTMLEPIESWSETIISGPREHMTDPPVLEADPVITEVYDARAAHLGLLGTDTVERVTMAYSVGKRLQRRLGRVQESDSIEGARVFGLLLDVVEFHLFINLAIRALEANEEDPTRLSWPAVDGEDIHADQIRDVLIEDWEMEDISVMTYQLDYRVEPATAEGLGSFERIRRDDDVVSLE
jgi:hypothetical protein